MKAAPQESHDRLAARRNNHGLHRFHGFEHEEREETEDDSLFPPFPHVN
jgi:hypothetical protein